MSADCELLIKALLAKPEAAENYWRKWRAETDLDAMSEDCVRLLPVLVARYSSWLAGDPSRNLILGLAKRAWTRNQIILRSLAYLLASLAGAGIRETAIAGPAAWALLHQGEKSFRPVFFLELLISREQVLPAADVLFALGWTLAPRQAVPRPEEFDYFEGIWFRNPAQDPLTAGPCSRSKAPLTAVVPPRPGVAVSGEALKLTWRLFPAPPERAAEWESLPPLKTVEFQGAAVRLPPRDVMLACALAGWRDGDHLDWRCDAVLLLSDGAVDWDRVRKWIQFSPVARIRLLELARETGAPIPFGLRRRPARLWFQWDLVRGDYLRRASIRGERRSLGGFIRYLCERWQTPAWQAPFLALFYLARYTFSGRPGGK